MSEQNDLKILGMMIQARAVEKRESILVRQGKSWTQIPCAGHEASVALIAQLEATDYLFAYYRSTHLRLAKGIHVEQMARDFFARDSSTSGGRSVSVHCGSRQLNVFPDGAPTGAQCLPAVGAAWGQKLRGKKSITLCCIGDGSTRQGEFYEAVCFAVQEKLPIIFLVEDNGYAISTKTCGMSPLALEIFDSTLLSVLEGTNADSVYNLGEKAIARVRSGDGPCILWSHVSRLGPHTIAEDHTKYRNSDELEFLIDPVNAFKKTLIESGRLTKNQVDDLQAAIESDVAQIYRDAEHEAAPDPAQIYTNIFADNPPAPPSLDLSIPGKQNMLSAVKETLRHALKTNPDVVLYGQDICDPKGGVFGITQGLSEQFPARVINAPLAEATMIGSAVGLAAEGIIPICEIQFIDFITPGFNQLVTHVSTLRWRSNGNWSCPMVLYATYGAYLPSGGLWHSQSNDAWWAHIPGLKLAIPSTAEDAAGLFWAAIHGKDPCLILLPKHLLRIPCEIGEIKTLDFGVAKRVLPGEDVTIVTWGNCVELVLKAIEKIKTRGISIELIDIRSLVPCDVDFIAESVKRTGRLVVVHEDTQTCGFGGHIVSQLITRVEIFTSLWTPPQIVARKDVPIPYHPDLEAAVLPGVDDVIAAVERVCADKSIY